MSFTVHAVRGRTPRALAAVALSVAIAFASLSFAANPDHDPNAFRIAPLSTQAQLVTGNDVLVRIGLPRNVALEDVSVTLNGVDITAAFLFDAPTLSLTGLVTNLVLGENTLEASASKGNGPGGPSKKLKIVNYPIAGPLLSGPHEQPYFCQTQEFTLPTTGGTLGAALDADCSIATRIDYVYRTTGNMFQPLDTTLPPPADLAMDGCDHRGRAIRHMGSRCA